MSQAPLPSEIQLHKQSRKLELVYNDQPYFLSAEFLRVHSPSAEVQGHGPGSRCFKSKKKMWRSLRLNQLVITPSKFILMMAMTADCSRGTICTNSPPIRKNTGKPISTS